MGFSYKSQQDAFNVKILKLEVRFWEVKQMNDDWMCRCLGMVKRSVCVWSLLQHYRVEWDLSKAFSKFCHISVGLLFYRRGSSLISTEADKLCHSWAPASMAAGRC